MHKSLIINVLITILDEVLDQIKLVRPDLIYKSTDCVYSVHKSHDKVLIHLFFSRAEIWIFKWNDRHGYSVIQASNPNMYEAILNYININLPQND